MPALPKPSRQDSPESTLSPAPSPPADDEDQQRDESKEDIVQDTGASDAQPEASSSTDAGAGTNGIESKPSADDDPKESKEAHHPSRPQSTRPESSSRSSKPPEAPTAARGPPSESSATSATAVASDDASNSKAEAVTPQKKVETILELNLEMFRYVLIRRTSGRSLTLLRFSVWNEMSKRGLQNYPDWLQYVPCTSFVIGRSHKSCRYQQRMHTNVMWLASCTRELKPDVSHSSPIHSRRTDELVVQAQRTPHPSLVPPPPLAGINMGKIPKIYEQLPNLFAKEASREVRKRQYFAAVAAANRKRERPEDDQHMGPVAKKQNTGEGAMMKDPTPPRASATPTMMAAPAPLPLGGNGPMDPTPRSGSVPYNGRPASSHSNTSSHAAMAAQQDQMRLASQSRQSQHQRSPSVPTAISNAPTPAPNGVAHGGGQGGTGVLPFNQIPQDAVTHWQNILQTNPMSHHIVQYALRAIPTFSTMAMEEQIRFLHHVHLQGQVRRPFLLVIVIVSLILRSSRIDESR